MFFFKRLQSISSDLVISSLSHANLLANSAVRLLNQRRSALVERREQCGRVATLPDRRSCFNQVFKLLKQIRRERDLINAMSKCNSVTGDMSKLVQCVTEMRLRHSLLSPDGVPKPAPGTVGKQQLVASIEKAVDSVSSNSDLAEEEAEEAIAMIRKRLETIASHWSMCKSLATPTMRISCRRNVVQMREENNKERALLRRLERCGEIYAFGENKDFFFFFFFPDSFSLHRGCCSFSLLSFDRKKDPRSCPIEGDHDHQGHCVRRHCSSCCQRSSRQFGRP